MMMGYGNLPYELVSLIGGFLKNTEKRLLVKHVCKKWRDAPIYDYCIEILFSFKHNKHFYDEIMKNVCMKQVVRLSLDMSIRSNMNIFNMNIFNMTNLQCIEFSDIYINEDILCCISKLEALQELILIICGITDEKLKFLRPKNLRRLALISCPIYDEGLEHVAKILTLEFLNLELRYISDDGLQYLHTLINLQKLHIRNFREIIFEGISWMHDRMLLQDLGFYECYGLAVDDMIQYFPKSLLRLVIENSELKGNGLKYLMGSKLQSLRLNENYELVDEGLQYLCLLEGLKELDISHCWNITDKGFEYISKIRSLEKLILCGCEITDEGLYNLRLLGRLKELDISNCHEITDEGLEKLILFCREITDGGLCYVGLLGGLKELNIAKCRKITDKGVEYISGIRSLENLIL